MFPFYRRFLSCNTNDTRKEHWKKNPLHSFLTELQQHLDNALRDAQGAIVGVPVQGWMVLVGQDKGKWPQAVPGEAELG